MASFATQRLLTRSCPLLLVLRVALLVCLAVALATCPLLKELGLCFAPLPRDPRAFSTQELLGKRPRLEGTRRSACPAPLGCTKASLHSHVSPAAVGSSHASVED